MPDPRRFHPYYIIEAFSKAQNKIQEHIITREVGKKKRCQDLTEAKKRAIEFTSDWKPLLHLQTEFDGKLLIPLNLD